jgi:ligand-binding SRPBCC domain-containing protein
MQTVNVSTEATIKCPLERVAAYASNPDNATEWYANIKSVRWKTARKISVGSQIEFIAHFLGRQLIYTYEIVEFVPNEKFVMRTVDGPFPMETTYLWKSNSASETRMTLINRGSPKGFSRFLAPCMAFAMKRANRKDLKRLKHILENKT